MMKKSILLMLFSIIFSCKKSEQYLKRSGDERSLKPEKLAITVAETKAPLYWSPYEYHIIREGQPDNYIPENEWQANIDWMEQQLKPYGYNMVCIDGWGDDNTYNEYGYRTKHASQWTHDYAWWSNYLQQKGMTLGIYNNPLWVIQSAADAGKLIKGTNIPLANIINPSENALWFKWVQVNNPGAEEYVKGYIQYYADMGVKYLRVDFLSWFETGYDQNLGTVGPSRPKADYEKALRWMREACDANGIFLSLVMPNLKNDGELENLYGDMIRINDDAGFESDWNRFNKLNRGQRSVDIWRNTITLSMVTRIGLNCPADLN